MQNGLFAQGEMDKTGKEVENVKDVSDLSAKINEKNSFFKTQNEPMETEETKETWLKNRKDRTDQYKRW